MTDHKITALDIVLLLLVATLWASAFSAIKIAVAELGPISVAAGRCLIAVLVLLPFLVRGRFIADLKKAPLLYLGLVGLLGIAMPFMLIAYGEQVVDSSLAALLMAIGPLATILGGHFITRDETITATKLTGILFGLLGVVLLLWRGSLLMGQTALISQLAILLAALGYVASNLMIRRVSGTVSALVISSSSLMFSAIFLVPAALFIDAPQLASLSIKAWGALLWLGIVPTAIGFTLRYVLIARAGASFVSYVGYLIPAIALVFGMVLLGEVLNWERLVGLGLILAGLAIARR